MTASTRIALGCALLLAALAAWNAMAVVDFDLLAMDDDINIYFNPHLGPPGAVTLQWMFTDVSYMRRYVPLGWLGFSSVYGISGLSPVGYHVANLAAHAANTVLLFALLLAMLRRWGRETGGGWGVVCAALGAALWALHPYRAETVGWASGLLYGPAGTWALLSVLAYLRMLGCHVGTRQRWRWLLVVALTYLASLLTYPIGLGLIGVFVLLEIAERLHVPQGGGRPPLRSLLVEKILLLIPAAVVLGVTLLASFGGRSFWVKPATLAEFGVIPRAAQAAYAGGAYLWRRWWPLDLTPAPTRLLEMNPADPVFWCSGLTLVVVTVALGVRRGWRRSGLLFWAAFFSLLAPLLGFTERPYFPCDRYDYFAGMVVSAAASFGLLRISVRWRAAALVTSLAIIGIFAGLQQRQLAIWTNMDTLRARIIAASDNTAFRISQYGVWSLYHAQRGDLARARSILAECERIHGTGPWLAGFRADLEGAASAAALHVRMGIDFSRAGRSREAREHFQAALRLDSGLAAAAMNYAVMRALDGDPLDALHWYFHGVAGSRDGVPSASRRRLLELIAESFWTTGRPQLAVRAAELALREAATPAEGDPARRLLNRYRATAVEGRR